MDLSKGQRVRASPCSESGVSHIEARRGRHPGGDEILGQLVDERVAAHADVLEALRSERCAGLLDRLAEFVVSPPFVSSDAKPTGSAPRLETTSFTASGSSPNGCATRPMSPRRWPARGRAATPAAVWTSGLLGGLQVARASECRAQCPDVYRSAVAKARWTWITERLHRMYTPTAPQRLYNVVVDATHLATTLLKGCRPTGPFASRFSAPSTPARRSRSPSSRTSTT